MLHLGAEYQQEKTQIQMQTGTGKKQILIVHSILCKFQMVQPHSMPFLMNMLLINRNGLMTLFQLWKRCCPMATKKMNWLMDLTSILVLNVPGKISMMEAITTTVEIQMSSVSLNTQIRLTYPYLLF